MFVVQLAYLAFFSIALPDSMLGVAWPSMRLAFGQPLSSAGLVPPVGVAASVVSTIAAPYLAARGVSDGCWPPAPPCRRPRWPGRP